MGPFDTATELDVSSPQAPWWVKPLYAFGVPSFIALALVLFLMLVVVRAQSKAQETLDAHIRDTAAATQSLHAICLILANGDPVRKSWCGAERP